MFDVGDPNSLNLIQQDLWMTGTIPNVPPSQNRQIPDQTLPVGADTVIGGAFASAITTPNIASVDAGLDLSVSGPDPLQVSDNAYSLGIWNNVWIPKELLYSRIDLLITGSVAPGDEIDFSWSATANTLNAGSGNIVVETNGSFSIPISLDQLKPSYCCSDVESLADLRATIDKGSGGGTSWIKMDPIGSSTAFLPGDFNGDGVVDAADYTVWRDSLGQTGVGLPADGDHSGTVDQADYDLWKTNFGLGGGSGASANTAVPEPSPLWMAEIAATILLVTRQIRFCPCWV